MENIKIRQAKLKDAKGIAKVHTDTWQFAYRGQLPDEYLDAISITRRTKRWKKILSKPQSNSWNLVAETNNKIVGFCSVGKCRDENAEDKTGELWAIYIDKDYMGKGIGTALMEEGLKILKENNFIKSTLWVLESNKKGRRFYEVKGWRVDGKKKVEKEGDVEFKEIRYFIDL